MCAVFSTHPSSPTFESTKRRTRYLLTLHPVPPAGVQVGSALAASFGGLAHDWFGNYQWAFLSAGLAGLAAAGFSLQVREGRRVPQPALA